MFLEVNITAMKMAVNYFGLLGNNNRRTSDYNADTGRFVMCISAMNVVFSLRKSVAMFKKILQHRDLLVRGFTFGATRLHYV